MSRDAEWVSRDAKWVCACILGVGVCLYGSLHQLVEAAARLLVLLEDKL